MIITCVYIPLSGAYGADKGWRRILRDNAASLADSVETVWAGSTGVEQSTQPLFTARALGLVEQLLLKIALFFQLLA